MKTRCSPKAATLVRFLVFVLAFFAFHSDAAEGSTRIVEPLSAEIEAGADLTVHVTPPLAPDGNLIATIGDSTVGTISLGNDGSDVMIRVPIDCVAAARQAVDRKLTLLQITNGKTNQVTGSVLLRVYPPAVPQISSINDLPKDQVPNIRRGETFTVKGSGFFAPETNIVFSVKGTAAVTKSVATDGSSFTAAFERDLPEPGDANYEVTVWNRPAEKRDWRHVWIEDSTKFKPGSATFFALIPVLLFTALLYLLSIGVRKMRTYRSAPYGGVVRNGLDLLLVDPSTNTYSLSRLQFLLWLFALVYAYAFVFYTRARVANDWGFPELGGGELAFLISLGTLVGSIATTSVIGSKGAGDVRPSPRDLLVHGGVVALDRVQQLIWTFVAIGLMISILYGSAGTTNTLPKIPDDLLKLMGISSLGYLAGKASRKAGPIVNDVISDGTVMRISGVSLSVSARVFVNGAEIAKAQIKPDKLSPNKPDEFAETLLVDNVNLSQTALKAVTVINPDGQEAKWAPPANTAGNQA